MADKFVELEKPETNGGNRPEPPKSKLDWVIFLLRLIAFFATLAATLVMALSKEKKSLVVATVGTTQIKATVTAKFQHTPAFVFFVIANGMVSLHNLLMLTVNVIRYICKFRRLNFLVIAVLDMMNVALVSGGASAAIFMGQLGRDGNTHARWNKICDKVDTFCDHTGGAMIASFGGLILMILINVISIAKVRKEKSLHILVIP